MDLPLCLLIYSTFTYYFLNVGTQYISKFSVSIVRYACKPAHIHMVGMYAIIAIIRRIKRGRLVRDNLEKQRNELSSP